MITKIFLIILMSATVGYGAVGISGTDHDFSNNTWSGGELCIVCHTPHGSDALATSFGGKLWNREISAGPFTPYDSDTLDAAVGTPDGSTRLCLSCHDGSIAIDSFGGKTGSSFVNGDAKINDLSTEHPVSFVYDSSLSAIDGGLFDPSISPSGLGGTVQNDMLRSNKVQCVSCHDVHNKYGVDDLLLKSNSGSSLCLTCHNK